MTGSGFQVQDFPPSPPLIPTSENQYPCWWSFVDYEWRVARRTHALFLRQAAGPLVLCTESVFRRTSWRRWKPCRTRTESRVIGAVFLAFGGMLYPGVTAPTLPTASTYRILPVGPSGYKSHFLEGSLMSSSLQGM